MSRLPRLTQLDNGLTVITDSMDAVETVSLGVWVDAGTRHETPDVNGVSHLLEHMAFKGTERRSARAIAEEIEAVGGMLNAYTSREQTAYYAKVLKEDSALAVDIIADILQHSVIDPEELAREQTVVLQEINQALDTPDDIVFDYFQSTAYPDQAVGRPVLGTADSVMAMTSATLHGYMRQHYSANRMVLTAAGRIEHEQLVDLAAQAFTALPPARTPIIEPARYHGGDYREDRDLEQVQWLLGFDGVRYDDPDFYNASVLSTLLGGGMSSRLFQEVREKRGLVYSIYSYASSYIDGGVFGVYAGTGAEEVTELVPVVCDELMKATRQIEEVEVRRARAQIKAGILMALESSGSRCEQAARQIQAYGRLIPIEEIVTKIDAVTPETVRACAARLFQGRPTLTALGPLAGLESFETTCARLG